MPGVSAELPSGCRWRRPTLDDAEAILELVTDHNTALVGFGDVTLDDIRDELADPGFDPTADAWLIHDSAGNVAGYGWAYGKGVSAMVEVDVVAGDAAVADWLWAQVLGRAVEMGAKAAHDTVTVDIGIYQTDGSQQARARSRAFVPATTFHRMRIDFEEPPPEPVVPDEVVVRSGPGDESLRRDAHDVSKRAFVDHFGFVEKSFAEWHEGIERSATHDWAQLRVAYLDGQPVAMVRGTDQFVEDENCGYVATVAVLPHARGRGLAKLMLREAFADDVRRHRRGTILHVDANNVTPALELYLSVGMRPVLAVDIWRARLPTRPPAQASRNTLQWRGDAGSGV
jgi:ribosomal protein S18 acetylase RimI-like enzyme